MARSKNGDIAAILVIIVVAFISYSPFLLKGNLINSDSWKNYYPWRAEYHISEIKTNYLDPNVEYGVWYPMAKEEILHGRFPHWNPYSFCGTPLYANHLVPVFHIPLTIALLFPANQVATIYSLLMALGGALFFYFFLRNWKLNPLVSIFGATAYLLSGWMILTHPPEVAVILWMPAILLFHDRFIERGRFLDVAFGAFFIGQLMMSGYPIYIVHFFYIAPVYVLWRRFHRSFTDRIPLKKWIVGVLMMAFFGILISAVQNYPSYEYLKLSSREITVHDDNVAQAVEKNKNLVEQKGLPKSIKDVLLKHLSEKSSFVLPVFMWNRGRNYIGPIIIYLALCALFIADRKFRIMKSLLVIVSILVIVPYANAVVSRFLPGFSISPFTPTQIFYFLMIFLASLSLDKLITNRAKIRSCGLIGLIIMISMIFLARLHPLYSVDLPQQVFRFDPVWDFYFIVFFVTIYDFILYFFLLMSMGTLRKPAWTIFTLILLIASSIVTSSYIHYHFDSPDPMPLSDTVKKLQEITKDGRIARYDPSEPKVMMVGRIDSILPPNIPGKFGIYDVQGYDSIILSDYTDFLLRVDPTSFLSGRGVKHYKTVESFHRDGLLPHGAGLRYIVTRGDSLFDELKSLYGDPIYQGEINVFKINERSNAFIRFVDNYTIVNGAENPFPLKPNMAILEKEPVLPDNRRLVSRNEGDDPIQESYDFTPTILKRTNTEIEIKFTAPSDGLVYFSETWHPRWRAELDGASVEILKANIAFRAIAVTSGEHTIRMWYDGIDVVIGGIISVAGLLIVFAIAFIDSSRKVKERNL